MDRTLVVIRHAKSDWGSRCPTNSDRSTIAAGGRPR